MEPKIPFKPPHGPLHGLGESGSSADATKSYLLEVNRKLNPETWRKEYWEKKEWIQDPEFWSRAFIIVFITMLVWGFIVVGAIKRGSSEQVPIPDDMLYP